MPGEAAIALDARSSGAVPGKLKRELEKTREQAL
jgi:hypothetical protein